MARPSTCPVELRRRAVRVVAGVRPEYATEWAAMKAVASKLGAGSTETLCTWVRQDQIDAGQLTCENAVTWERPSVSCCDSGHIQGTTAGRGGTLGVRSTIRGTLRNVQYFAGWEIQVIIQLQLITRLQVNPRGHGRGASVDAPVDGDDAMRAGLSLGHACPTRQTSSPESAEGEVMVAAYDYERVSLDASGRRVAPLKGDWTEVEVQRSADTHDQVHLSVTLEPPKLIVGVKPHTDTRLHQLFADGVGPPVRAALERLGTRPDSRPLEFAPWETPYRDWVVVIDRGDDLVVAVPRDINPHLLRAFDPAAAEYMRQTVLPGGDTA